MTMDVMIMVDEKKAKELESFCRDCLITCRIKYPRLHRFSSSL